MHAVNRMHDMVSSDLAHEELVVPKLLASPHWKALSKAARHSHVKLIMCELYALTLRLSESIAACII